MNQLHEHLPNVFNPFTHISHNRTLAMQTLAYLALPVALLGLVALFKYSLTEARGRPDAPIEAKHPWTPYDSWMPRLGQLRGILSISWPSRTVS